MHSIATLTEELDKLYLLVFLRPKSTLSLNTGLSHVFPVNLLRSFGILSPLCSHLHTPDSHFDKIHIYIVDPLPLSQRHRYLLTHINRFTSWSEAFSKTANLRLRKYSYS